MKVVSNRSQTNVSLVSTSTTELLYPFNQWTCTSSVDLEHSDNLEGIDRLLPTYYKLPFCLS